MATLTDIINWWSGRRVPTVLQRQQTFSSFFHKDEPIPMSAVDGLSNALNNVVSERVVNANTTLTLNAKEMLEKIFLKPSAIIYINIGTTNGGNEIVADTEITTDGLLLKDLDVYMHTGGIIYITGVTNETFLKFYIRK